MLENFSKPEELESRTVVSVISIWLSGGWSVSGSFGDGEGVDLDVRGVEAVVGFAVGLPRPANRISSEDSEEIDSLLGEDSCGRVSTEETVGSSGCFKVGRGASGA